MPDTLLLANAGTVWLFLSLGHFLIGNILLGIIEGLILARVFKTRRKSSISTMIGANYASAIVGGLATWGVYRFLEQSIPPGGYIRWMGWTLLAAVVFSFLITILIEWPFAARLAGSPRRAWRRALLPIIGVHCLTYPMLAVWYWTSADLSIYLRLRHDHTLSFVDPALARKVSIYYIDPQKNEVWRMRLDGSARERVTASSAETGHAVELFLWPSNDRFPDPSVPQPVDLWLISADSREVKDTKLIENISPAGALDAALVEAASSQREFVRPVHFSTFHPIDLRSAKDRDWMPKWDSMFRQKSSGEELHASLFHRWYRYDDLIANGPIMVQGGIVVQSIRIIYPDKRDEIAVIDLDKKMLGSLGSGVSPIVIFESNEKLP